MDESKNLHNETYIDKEKNSNIEQMNTNILKYNGERKRFEDVTNFSSSQNNSVTSDQKLNTLESVRLFQYNINFTYYYTLILC